MCINIRFQNSQYILSILLKFIISSTHYNQHVSLQYQQSWAVSAEPATYLSSDTRFCQYSATATFIDKAFRFHLIVLNII